MSADRMKPGHNNETAAHGMQPVLSSCLKLCPHQSFICVDGTVSVYKWSRDRTTVWLVATSVGSIPAETKQCVSGRSWRHSRRLPDRQRHDG